jgi:hypothetical protein
MVETLVRAGAPLEVTDADFGGTPLGWAIHGSEQGWNVAAGNYADTVAILLKGGAKPPAEVSGSAAVQAVLRTNTRR